MSKKFRYTVSVMTVDADNKPLDVVFSLQSTGSDSVLDALWEAKRSIEAQMEIEGAKLYRDPAFFAVPECVAGMDFSDDGGRFSHLHMDRKGVHASGLNMVPLPRRTPGQTGHRPKPGYHNPRPETLNDLPTFTKAELAGIADDAPKVEDHKEPIGDEVPQGCICNAVSNPPCGFCEAGGEEKEKLRDV